MGMWQQQQCLITVKGPMADSTNSSPGMWLGYLARASGTAPMATLFLLDHQLRQSRAGDMTDPKFAHLPGPTNIPEPSHW